MVCVKLAEMAMARARARARAQVRVTVRARVTAEVAAAHWRDAVQLAAEIQQQRRHAAFVHDRAA